MYLGSPACTAQLSGTCDYRSRASHQKIPSYAVGIVVLETQLGHTLSFVSTWTANKHSGIIHFELTKINQGLLEQHVYYDEVVEHAKP